MPTNDFKAFAGGSGASVLTQSAYAAMTTIIQNGFPSGILPGVNLNKVLRQATVPSSVLAQLIVDITGQNAVDDGTTSTLLANLKAAIKTLASSQFVAPVVGTSSQGVTLGASLNLPQNSGSFTAPAAGHIYAFGGINLGNAASVGVSCSLAVVVNSVLGSTLSSDVTLLSQWHQGVAAVAAGDVVQVRTTVVTTSATGTVGTIRAGGFFVPA